MNTSFSAVQICQVLGGALTGRWPRWTSRAAWPWLRCRVGRAPGAAWPGCSPRTRRSSAAAAACSDVRSHRWLSWDMRGGAGMLAYPSGGSEAPGAGGWSPCGLGDAHLRARVGQQARQLCVRVDRGADVVGRLARSGEGAEGGAVGGGGCCSAGAGSCGGEPGGGIGAPPPPAGVVGSICCSHCGGGSAGGLCTRTSPKNVTVQRQQGGTKHLRRTPGGPTSRGCARAGQGCRRAGC